MVDQIVANIPSYITYLVVGAIFLGVASILMGRENDAAATENSLERNHEDSLAGAQREWQTGENQLDRTSNLEIALAPQQETERQQYRAAAQNLANAVGQEAKDAHAKGVKAGDLGAELVQVTTKVVQEAAEIADPDTNVGASKKTSSDHITALSKARKEIGALSAQLDRDLAAKKKAA